MKTKSVPFKFAPAEFIPFRDQKVLDRVRAIKREDITKHRNKDYRIKVIPDAEFGFVWLNDMFYRIKTAIRGRATRFSPPCSTSTG
jgi:glucosamine-6-phosphate deaminase